MYRPLHAGRPIRKGNYWETKEKLSHMSINQVEKLWQAGEISTHQVDIYIKSWNRDGKKFLKAKRMCNYIHIS